MPEVVVGNGTRHDGVGTLEGRTRDRLIDAATRAATEKGYDDVDVEEIARYAGVSVDEFHECFATKDQCMLAAFDRFVSWMRDHVDEACEHARDWPDKVRLSIKAVFSFLTEVEPVARVFVVEAGRNGPATLDRRCTSIDAAALRLKQGRLLFPAAADYPDSMERTLISGVVLIASTHLLAEDAKTLSELEAETVEMVLTPYIGSREARLVASGSPVYPT
jgi:AcrR family transcriptional regulator